MQRLAGWKELDARWQKVRSQFGDVRLRPLFRALTPANLEKRGEYGPMRAACWPLRSNRVDRRSACRRNPPPKDLRPMG